jgi:hypothetical protein
VCIAVITVIVVMLIIDIALRGCLRFIVIDCCIVTVVVCVAVEIDYLVTRVVWIVVDCEQFVEPYALLLFVVIIGLLNPS